MERDPLEWMTLQSRAMYDWNGAGRITGFNEPDGKVVDCPIVFVGRTEAGNVTGVRRDVPEPAAREIEGLLAAEPSHGGDGPPQCAAEVRRCVESFSPVRVEWCGPAFRFGDRVSVPDGLGELRRIEPRDHVLVCEAFPKLEASVHSRDPIFAIVEKGRVQSACFAATGLGPAVEAGVDTREDARGRGFAPRVVAAWADRVIASGRLPLYSTSWNNLASRAVARKLGLVVYGSDWHLR